MGQALYRTYRSRSFDEVIGQEHITLNLAKAVKVGRISHAYLFAGPRGVGKTSVARILAHAVNGLEYQPESLHLDIIEIDAASNRRIDEIRDIRDKVNIAPTSAKYKIYIIDEVHMLTKEAFNALLKTLEEPPAHVIFILATTDAHKLPETIVSRTQRYNFKAVPPEAVTKHLASIAEKEKIKVDSQALDLIAVYGGGSFRDSIGLLDQLAHQDERLTAELVRQHLGLPEAKAVTELLAAVTAAQPGQILELLNQLRQQAVDASLTAKMLADEIRAQTAAGQSSHQLFSLLRDLIEVPASPYPYEALEINLLLAAAEHAGSYDERTQTLPSSKPTATHSATKPSRSINSDSAFDLTMWPDVVAEVKNHSGGLYAALRLANPEINEGELKLKFQFGLHQKKAAGAVSRQIIGDAVEKVSGAKLKISCVLEPVKTTAGDADLDFYRQPTADPQLEAINNIFGPTEVLEGN